MKTFNYDVVKDYKLYNILTPATALINNIMYKTAYIGQENIPSGGAFILAANHRHGIDPFIAPICIKHRGVHYISKNELFFSSLSTWFFTNMNSFPVHRGKADVKAIRYAIKLLKNGKILGIFPEGTRSATGEFGEAKNGTVYLAAKTKSDILPVSLYYVDDKPRKTATIRYGKVIKFEELGLPEKPSKEQYAKATEYLMSRIKEMYDLGPAV